MTKLNGYRASHRNRWLLLQNKALTLREFILFEFYLDSMDFDQKHDKFGTFEVFFDEIAEIFNKKKDAVRNWHNGLVSKGFIKLFDKKRRLFEVKTPLRYLTGGRWGGKAGSFAKEEKNNQSLESLLENICFSPQKVGKTQKNKACLACKNNAKALASYKGEYRVNSKKTVMKQRVRSDAEYQKILEEGDCGCLTIDDMKWIDKNVK